jgi:DNA-binding XRE family transcriptional regulator
MQVLRVGPALLSGPTRQNVVRLHHAVLFSAQGLKTMLTQADKVAGQNLQRLRRQQCLSLGNLALKTGLSPEQLLAFEYGQTRVPPALLLQLADCLGAPVSAFFQNADMDRTGAWPGSATQFHHPTLH